MPGNVDPVILQLEAKLGTYNADVTGASNVTEQSLTRIQNAAKTTEKVLGTSFNNARISQQIMMRAGKGMADQYAASGLSMQMFTTHLGELSEAAVFAGGSMGKLGAFLGTGWGIAAVLAANVLLPVIANLFKAGDGVEELVAKLKEHFEKSQASARANEIFGRTVDGVTQALADNRLALEKLNLVQDTSAEKALKLAEAERLKALAVQKTTVSLLEQAKAAEELLIQSTARGSGIEGAGAQSAGISSAISRAADLQKQLDQANANVAEAERQVASGRANVIVGQANETKEQKINHLYDQRIDAAKALAIAEGKVGDALAKQVEQINKAREAELKRLHETSKGNNSYVGGELTAAQAASIARAAGLQVNSSTRTYGQQSALYDKWVAEGKPASNPVARPGTSAHEGTNGRWALDIQLGPGVTPELLRKVFAAQGVTLTKILPEQGHLHIEGKQSQDVTDAERAAEAEKKKAEALDQQVAAAAQRYNIEQEINGLRATGNKFEAQIADWLQADLEIQNQFPGLATSTNAADQKRLQTLKDIARAAIDERYAREGSLVDSKVSAASLLGEITKGADEEIKAQGRAVDQLHHKQEEQVRTLAGLYQDLFTGGTQSIWQDFKKIGTEVIAEVMARFTLSALSGNKFNLLDALGSALGVAAPGFGSSSGVKSGVGLFSAGSVTGFASGGSMVIGGNGGTDQNMLSLNGQPLARVSAGEVLNIANPRLAQPPSAQPAVVRIEVAEGQLFATRVTQISGDVAVQVVQAAAPALTNAAVSQTVAMARRRTI